MHAVQGLYISGDVADLETGEYTLAEASEKCSGMDNCQGFSFNHPDDTSKMTFTEGKVTILFKGKLNGSPPFGTHKDWSSFFKDPQVAKEGMVMRNADAEATGGTNAVEERKAKRTQTSFAFSDEAVESIQKVLRLYGAKYGLSLFEGDDDELPMAHFSDTVIPGTHPDLTKGEYTLAEAYGLCSEEPTCFGLTFQTPEDEVDVMTTKLFVWFKYMLQSGELPPGVVQVSVTKVAHSLHLISLFLSFVHSKERR
jgi:hypothetical protein